MDSKKLKNSSLKNLYIYGNITVLWNHILMYVANTCNMSWNITNNIAQFASKMKSSFGLNDLAIDCSRTMWSQ